MAKDAKHMDRNGCLDKKSRSGKMIENSNILVPEESEENSSSWGDIPNEGTIKRE